VIVVGYNIAHHYPLEGNMDKDLLQQLGIGSADADFIKDKNAKHEALDLLVPSARAVLDIARLTELSDPLRLLRQSELSVFNGLNGALKKLEQQNASIALERIVQRSLKTNVVEISQSALRLGHLPEKFFPIYKPAESFGASSLAAVALKNHASLSNASNLARDAFERSTQFSLPAMSVTQDYLGTFQAEQVDFLKTARISLFDGGISDALARMRTPWLNLNKVTESISGVVGLHALGLSLSTQAPFDRATTQLVRNALGDWRDFSTPSNPSVLEAPDREIYYRERGLEPTLIEFPAEAFEQLAEDTGLTAGINALISLFDIDPQGTALSEAALHRATVAYRLLLQLEVCLRRFIHGAMKKEFGEDWPRQRLPPSIYELWKDKQSKAEAKGEAPCPLIEYADFTDYLTIIQRRDNWSAVFKSMFHRKEDVVESLQRLGPLRLSTMHARPTNITNSDIIMLLSETTRIVGITRMHAGRLQ
jgi:hypothetical protein